MRILHAMVVLAWIAVSSAVGGGCGGGSKGDGATAPAESGSSPAAGGGASGPTECGGAGFPCTQGDVDPARRKRSHELAQKIAQAFGDGKSIDDAKKLLEAESDVEMVMWSDDAVRFRVTGGRPQWVFRRTAANYDSIGVPPAMPLAFFGSPSDEKPIGKNPAGRKPRKQALLMSPFFWQWGLTGDSDELDGILTLFTRARDYEEGKVVVRKSRVDKSGSLREIRGIPPLKHWKDWREYDAIHISTHGGRVTDSDGHKQTGLSTSIVFDFDDSNEEEMSSKGLEEGWVPLTAESARAMTGIRGDFQREQSSAKPSIDGAPTPYTVGPFIIVTTRFFRETYGGGLADKIIFLSACQSGMKDDLLTALQGPRTTVLGWDQSMGLAAATKVAQCFWRLTLGGRLADEPADKGAGELTCAAIQEALGDARLGGLSVKDAYDQLKKMNEHLVIQGGPSKSFVEEGGMLTHAPSGAELGASGEVRTRAIEIIELLDPDTEQPLEDGDVLSLVGAPGDGKPDELEVLAEVFGIGPEQDAKRFKVHLALDDNEVGDPFDLTEKISDFVYRRKETVKLGKDLSPDATVTLEPSVELQHGGESRWRYEDLSIAHLVLKVSGPSLGGTQTYTVPIKALSGNFFDSATYVKARRTTYGPDDVHDEGTDGSGILYVSMSIPGAAPGKYTKPQGTDMAVYLRNAGKGHPECPDYADDCKMSALRLSGGTIEIVKREKVGRKHRVKLKISGAFERTDTPGKGRDEYQVEGTFDAKL